MARQVRQDLDDLGEEDPRTEQAKCEHLSTTGPISACEVQQHDLERVPEHCRRLELTDIDDVQAHQNLRDRQ